MLCEADDERQFLLRICWVEDGEGGDKALTSSDLQMGHQGPVPVPVAPPSGGPHLRGHGAELWSYSTEWFCGQT